MNNIIKVAGHDLAFNVFATRYLCGVFNLSTDPRAIIKFLDSLHIDSYGLELVRAGLEGYAKMKNTVVTLSEWEVAEIYQSGTADDANRLFAAFMGCLWGKTTDEAMAFLIELEGEALKALEQAGAGQVAMGSPNQKVPPANGPRGGTGRKGRLPAA